MPFTFAHPAAVLPLRRTLWFPGLVAGSIAPDAGYYIPLGPGGELTHSALGLPVDVLLGAALLAIAWMARAPLLRLIGRTTTLSWPGVWRAAAALGVGALTHVAWDSLTHTDGIAVQHWEVLREAVIGPHRVYNVIGYISSALGLLALAWYAARWFRRTRPGPALPHRRWVLTGFACAALLGGLTASTDPVTTISLYDAVRHVLVGAIRAMVIAVGAYVAIAFSTRGKV
ncbi:DUF4184 family protein [Nocardia huaxiensis]|uniref:DUF4184 family protein n=1 Tax=Nocardia huaxiensis TaxID=2755382 RepID=A0A7D6Z647_9NOCA|nr:DUF4184 family protein [Nocardia huaxiensis]QLY32464.1 DUF4184 family protein [Nocardia huaxiensis]UFS93829.1 DUF4184 family protein [Nocardia huaxiensis]